MTIEDLQILCKTMKGVTEDIKWQDHLCFNIGGKMFLITSPDSIPVSASFQVTPEEFDEISHKEGFTPAPYLAKYNWVHLDDITRLSKKEWYYFARQSYELKAEKLSKKIKIELGLIER